ncbi:MAG: GntR family transcriptional regulator [Longimicrobiales bacterium]
MERTPPYQQVVEHYRAAIRTGQLAAGDELPSTRRLAAEWGVATSTAQRLRLSQLRTAALWTRFAVLSTEASPRTTVSRPTSTTERTGSVSTQQRG